MLISVDLVVKCLVRIQSYNAPFDDHESLTIGAIVMHLVKQTTTSAEEEGKLATIDVYLGGIGV